MKRAVLLALPLLLGTGCYLAKNKEDVPWNRDLVGQIEVGKTTKAELLQILGPPTQIVRLLESEAFVYRHTIEKETGTFLLLVNMQRADKQYDAITVIVDRQGTVTAVGSRFSADESSYGLPFGD